MDGGREARGHAQEVNDPEHKATIIGNDVPADSSHLFRADVTELVVVRLGEPADHLVIETWHAERGVTRHERR